jgi:hypothetical protein
MAKTAKRATRRRRTRALGPDEGLIALFIGAMDANGRIASDEAARAHHLIWSTRRFRRRSGDTVGRLIQDVRTLLEKRGVDAVIADAARAIPRRLRPAAYALVSDLLLADGRIDAGERRFLERLGSMLAIDPGTARQVVDAILLKNQL